MPPALIEAVSAANAWFQHPRPFCPLRALTGIDCPLCGATRATFALMRGDVVAALDQNLLYVVCLPLLAAIAAVWLLRWRPPALLANTTLRRAAVVVVVGFSVVRNIPVGPFAWLESGL